jgi:hypothetical protein
MGAMDAKASADTSRRLKRQLLQAAEMGKPWGRRYFGYNQDGSLHPIEAPALREMVTAALAGLSYRRIARTMNDKGIQTSQGNPVWGAPTVRYVLMNPAMTALRTHKGAVVGEGNWEPIIDRATWNQLQAALTRPDRRTVTPARTRLLSSLCSCGKCGHTLSYAAARRAPHTVANDIGGHEVSPRERSALVCSTAVPGTGCGGLSIAVEPLERYVQEAFLGAVPKIVPRAAEEDVPFDGENPTEIEAQLRELAAMWANQELTRDEWIAARSTLQKRLAAANIAIVAHQRQKGVQAAVPDFLSVREGWAVMTEAEKHTVLEAFIDRIVIVPVGQTGRAFNFKRIQIKWKV